MIRTNEQCEREGLRRVAELMCVAARTAPKARGRDNIVTAIVEGETDRRRLADRMIEIGERAGAEFFKRDAANLMDAPVVVILGTRLQRLGIPGCSFCGHDGCAEAERADARCAYNAGDLGIAVGTAVACAADHRVDNRVMYSIGAAAVEMELLGAEVRIAFGIPLSASGKSIFFDRR
ncbi:MAG: ferredoxin domain-containing protein [Armatimonadota bacterium]